MNDAQVSYEVPYGVVNVGKDEMEDARLSPTVRRLYDRLKNIAVEKYGDTSCQTISRCDWYDPEDVKARRLDGRRDECTRFVGETARILGKKALRRFPAPG